VFFSGLLGWLPAEGTHARGPMPRYLTQLPSSQKSSSSCLACTPAASLKSIATDKTSDLCCHRTSHHVVTYSQYCIAQCAAKSSSASPFRKKLQWSQPGTTKDLFPGTATTSKTSQADTQRLPARHHILRPRFLRPCLPSRQSGIARHADRL
jgi:hypothetical protein